MMGVTDAYLVLIPMSSLKDEDSGLAHKKDFGAALGEEGRNKLNKLSEQNVVSVEDNLWLVNPEWSYVEKSWIDADPHYWAYEPAAKPAHKSAKPHMRQRRRQHSKNKTAGTRRASAAADALRVFCLHKRFDITGNCAAEDSPCNPHWESDQTLRSCLQRSSPQPGREPQQRRLDAIA